MTMVSMAMTHQERVHLAHEIALLAPKGSGAHPCGCDVTPESTASVTEKGVGQLDPVLARSIDHALLRADASSREVQHFLASAESVGFRSVCLQPRWAALAVRMLQGSDTIVASLVGYPHGTTLTPVKCVEAETLVRLGVQELSMVADIGAIRSGDLDTAFTDIRAVASVAHCRSVRLNVILNLPLLDERQKVQACVVTKLAGAHSAISATDGLVADASDIELMQRTVGGDLDVVAAGEIRTIDDARRAMQAGATRVITEHWTWFGRAQSKLSQ